MKFLWVQSWGNQNEMRNLSYAIIGSDHFWDCFYGYTPHFPQFWEKYPPQTDDKNLL